MKLVLEEGVIVPHFRYLLDDNEHYIILLLGSASSGKSYFSFQRAIIRCIQDKRKYLILRKYSTDVRRSCFEDVKSILNKWQLAAKVKINVSTMQITFPNGSEMLFSGCDDVEKLKSIPNVTDAIFEEASEFSPYDFDQIKIRLRGKGKLKNQIVLQTNPISKVNWIYKRFFMEGNQEQNSVVDRSTYKDNPHTNQETIDSLESYKTTNPAYYTVYALGEFGSLSQLVYTNWKIKNLNIEELRQNKSLILCVGLDWGFSFDETAIIEILADNENKKLYVINEFYQKGMINSEIANQLEKMGLAKATIIADSAEPKSIEELKREGIRRIKPCMKGKGSIKAGIAKVKEYEIFVAPWCLETINELQNYSYKKDRATGEYIDEPEDAFNHLMDAMRYSIQCADTSNRLRTLPKNTL